ncbi:GNAT family N-acetyltransferase [Enterococcus columbae]|uniref:N-acetyltransferase domain-containing protein n=1 Tax=Enterococcus columbae DSM 7374 = ATCC 51263 TaxID=1121865 RepID=S1P332_9ENTE|nr:GNAT family N-acetyltransferase [Enterococcus columbae]EOT44620.1 hypothetical protein OMW_00676 [Enterococcus columbae DSM 7374 = ATCC 51263]EOW87484.1 hypothetical protein I568_00528 [Enterococcus columbae DSM 7374 = ATCC 51263]OJG25140.1 hypothetical protein RR47_GL001928 [Enterococcus columbae DSM 7374 = ATCC 51263]
MNIRLATIQDIEKIYQLEQLCFPKEEAASKQALAERLAYFANHFLLMEHQEQIIGMVNGMVCHQSELTDNLYAQAHFHDENGEWQMIFGVDTHPAFRHQGVASQLLAEFIQQAKAQGRKGVVLTCKAELIPFYEQFQFVNQGISASTHGNVQWYLMQLIF